MTRNSVWCHNVWPCDFDLGILLKIKHLNNSRAKKGLMSTQGQFKRLVHKFFWKIVHSLNYTMVIGKSRGQRNLIYHLDEIWIILKLFSYAIFQIWPNHKRFIKLSSCKQNVSEYFVYRKTFFFIINIWNLDCLCNVPVYWLVRH